MQSTQEVVVREKKEAFWKCLSQQSRENPGIELVPTFSEPWRNRESLFMEL